VTDDPRPRVPLNGKTVDLAQLSVEVGTPLSSSDTEVVVADPDSTVTVADLQAALDAHTPAAPVDAEVEFRKALEDATSWQTLRDALLGKAGPGAEPRRPDGR
jgi:hypothetical protein